MPEELGIALVVLVIAGWVIVKLIQALVIGVSSAHNGLTRSIEEKARQLILWRKSKLAQHVHAFVPNDIERAQYQVDLAMSEFKRAQASTAWIPRRPTWQKADFAPYVLATQSDAREEMNVEDINRILLPERRTWLETESSILAQGCRYPFDPPSATYSEFREVAGLNLRLEEPFFRSDKLTKRQISRYFAREQQAVVSYSERRSMLLTRCKDFNRDIESWNIESRRQWISYVDETRQLEEQEFAAFILHRQRYERECGDQKERINMLADGFRAGRKQEVIIRVEHVLSSLTVPHSIPRRWEIDFDEDQRILIVEVELPDVVHNPPVKTVFLKNGVITKPLNLSEKREIIPKVHPAVLLRFAYEIFRNDDSQIINLLVLNGWLNFDDPYTGLNKKAYTASLMLERSQIESLNLTKLDPLAAFQGLNGKSAGKLVEIIPIEPSLALNKKDSRFVDAKAVLNMLGSATNLAAMDWQDFEHLIRELFEKEFAGRGAEVKITQASRDRGVDAIAFDPDPIHGGKYVIQAKRYSNTVDVSAVRDLCAVVRKEGASRGILVTTSTFGADAYAFANNEPVTLLNGAELLGLLKKHGYSFRINLQEARTLNLTNLRKERTPQAD